MNLWFRLGWTALRGHNGSVCQFPFKEIMLKLMLHNNKIRCEYAGLRLAGTNPR